MAKNESAPGPDMKTLFDTYGKIDADATAKKEAYDAAMAKRSECVGGIIKRFGKGPYEYNGQLYTGVVRKSEDVTDEATGEVTPGKTTAFFKSPGNKQIIKV